MKIGDFSRIGRVSVKALRFYDQVGLLKPTSTDRDTGYRHYSVNQLPRLNRILALKELGFTLEQIGPLLSEQVAAPEIRGMLQLKRAEIEQRLARDRMQLARVQARIQQIEQEENMAHYDIVVKPSEITAVAAARDTGRDLSHMPALCEELCGEVHALLAQTNTKDSRPWLAFYHDMGGYRDTDIDVEMAAPVDCFSNDEAHCAVGRARFREEPSGLTVASVVHHGEMARIGEAYAAIGAWIEVNGYVIDGPCREIYLRHPSPDVAPEEAVTEIQFPVSRRAGDIEPAQVNESE